ncbi:MAG: ABC transporter ATP-binding protein/permease [Rhodospirillales bacterium]
MSASRAGGPPPGSRQEDASDYAPGLTSATLLRRFLPYVWEKGRRDLKARILIGAVLLIVAKGFLVTVPALLGAAVDALSPDEAGLVAIPLGIILAYGAARVLAMAGTELRDALFAKVAQNAMRRLALGVFRHLHRLSLRFHLERQTGGMTRAIERGTKSIELLLFYVVFSILPTLVEVLLVATLLWIAFGFVYAGITLATVGVYVLFTSLVTNWRIRLRRRMNESDQEAGTKAIDSLLNYETVKYFGNEEHEARRYDKALARYEDAAIKSRTSLAFLNTGQALLIAVGVTAIMLVAAKGVAAGQLTVGDFVEVNTYLIQLTIPLNFLGTVYREIRQNLADLERLFLLMQEGVEITDRPAAPALNLRGGGVVFEGVGFAYDARRPVLRDVSFEIPAGESLAIVGATGSGKSTLSKLLFRFYDVTQGRILIDGQDIREVTQASLRAAIGVVPQDSVLFNDTIAYNIAYGRIEASEAEVREAARMARIADFIADLPDGWETRVGERGLKLSGGEKQRVAIARALLKAPPILILDEATSALDSATERALQADLAAVSRGRTSLIIAHRLSTIVDSDQILVLDRGVIVERGRHRALLAAEGAYAALWAKQQSGEPDRIYS